jgi:hypothetical protein
MLIKKPLSTGVSSGKPVERFSMKNEKFFLKIRLHMVYKKN